MADKKSNVKGQLSKVHFIGIGGIGMSALARWYKSQGWAAHSTASTSSPQAASTSPSTPSSGPRGSPRAGSGRATQWLVSGSDLAASVITRELQKEGVKVKIGHKRGGLPKGAGLVIYSQAIRQDNPELRAARRFGIHALSYPEAVGELTKKYLTVAIAGAHGKSTTTAIVGLILIKAGLDPTVIIGTNLREFRNRNFRAGKKPWLVLEADEFGRAFLRYSPTVAIVTNIDREHLDTYKNLGGIKKAFLKFLARTKSGGTLILNRDDKNLYSLGSVVEKLAKEKSLELIWYGRHGIDTTIISQLLHNDSKKDKRKNLSGSYAAYKIKKVIRIPGEHNLSNAMAAYSLSKVLKIPEKKILAAIGSYRGAWRRMEHRGKLEIGNWKLEIFDDYAHHPTEIKATLAAFREKFPKSKITCIFQPHQAERLRLLFKDFISAFEDADVLILLPTYQVVGRERSTKHQALSIKLSEKLARAIQKKYPRKPIVYLNDPKKIKAAISAALTTNPFLRKSAHGPRQSSVLVMMGAGDIVKYTDALIA